MLSTLVTAAAELIACGAFFWAWADPDATTVFAFDVFLIIAWVVGTASLILGVVAIRSRRVPAPRLVTVVALMIAALPWGLICLWLLFFSLEGNPAWPGQRGPQQPSIRG
jgi:hypothetical protein